MPTDNPLRLQVIDRVVEVLRNIEQGDDYYASTGEVFKKFQHWEDCQGFPAYMVFADSGGTIEGDMGGRYRQTFVLNVKGYVRDSEDTVAALERALADVRHAIDADTLPGAGAGSLGSLGALVFFREGPTTDNGYLSIEGYGFFEQKIEVEISGEF
jgi:hypothetical protein